MSIVFLCCALIIPWLLAGWLRLPRYAAYFQQVAHNHGSYAAWLGDNKAESLYLRRCIIGLVLLPIFSCGAFFFLPASLFRQPHLLWVLDMVFLLGVCYIATHDRLPAASLTAQSRRLLGLSFFVELVPVLVGAEIISSTYDMLADPKNSPESMVLAPAFVLFIILTAMMTGPVTFFLTPYMLFIANAVNRPIDTIHQFIAWAKRALNS